MMMARLQAGISKWLVYYLSCRTNPTSTRVFRDTGGDLSDAFLPKEADHFKLQL